MLVWPAMITFRYLSKEVFSAMASVTVILLLIFLSNQFVRYLSYAADGNIPGIFVFKLMMLEVGNLIGLILPMGFFLGVLLAYGRLYADSEMTILNACGMSKAQLLMMTLILASSVAFVDGLFMFWLGPKVAADRDRILLEGRSVSIVETISPKRFQSLNEGKQLFYVESLSHGRDVAKNIFMARFTDHWEIATAEAGSMRTDEKNNTSWVVLKNGQAYSGVPGQRNYQVVEFAELSQRLPLPKKEDEPKERGLSTLKLWPINNSNPLYAAELQWRFAMPISVLLMALIAVPLSEVRSRQGKFAKLLPALSIYIIYANLLFATREWIKDARITPDLGMWWLHGILLMLGILLYVIPTLRIKRR